MISLRPIKGRKSILAALALLACLAMVYLFGSLNLNAYLSNDELDLKRQNLARYRQKVLEKKNVEKELLGLQNIYKRAEAALLTGSTPSLAAAEIQEIVTKIAKAADAQIMSIRILQPDRSGKEIYQAIPVEVTITSTIRELTQMLYKLDTSAKLLRIAKLKVRLRRGHGGPRAPGGSVEIVTTLTVEGFVKATET